MCGGVGHWMGDGFMTWLLLFAGKYGVSFDVLVDEIVVGSNDSGIFLKGNCEDSATLRPYPRQTH